MEVMTQIVLVLVAAYLLMHLLSELAKIQNIRQHMKFYKEDREREEKLENTKPAKPEKDAEDIAPPAPIESIKDIPNNTMGCLLIAAISVITTESRTGNTPGEVLEALNKRADDVKTEAEAIEAAHRG